MPKKSGMRPPVTDDRTRRGDPFVALEETIEELLSLAGVRFDRVDESVEAGETSAKHPS